MRQSLRAVAVLLVALLAVPMFAAGHSLVDDVIRMYKSGVPEESIVQFVQKTDGRFDVSADDLIAMADAKVPRTIIKAVLDESDARNGREAVRDTRAPSSSTVVVERPYNGYGYYDPYYYSPYWYPGYYTLGLGFVGFYGGGFRGGFHGGFHGGGGHGGGGHGHH